MSARRCPTPHKARHRTQANAQKALDSLRRDKDLGDDWNVYECRCGNWHIGHKPGSLRKRIREALQDRP